ncbi:MAG: universal stress protein [Hoeflea sp.]|uniref:universal stress protein n=1 Tax=Hoeflea sp. TaxID=1940281 RepID=UPI002731AF6B|nr:universal stress protein [Hoeflea sp.]MDP2122512.1 universal stress protein [Hoeflea sp.]
MDAILVAADLSEHSAWVLERAAKLASHYDATPTVIHVIEGGGDETIALRDTVEQQALATLREQVSRAGFKTPPEILVKSGIPHQIITRTSTELAADLIVIGPGSSSTILERIFGSTADRVVRTATVPVLIVRNEPRKPYRTAVVAIDFSTASEVALQAARTLMPDVQRRLLHACEIPLQFEQAMMRAPVSSVEAQQYRQSRLKQSRRQLRDYARQHGSLETASVQLGSPVQILVNHSRKANIDLMVLGSQGRNALAQSLLGSVARRVVAEAECDVLITNGF